MNHANPLIANPPKGRYPGTDLRTRRLPRIWMAPWGRGNEKEESFQSLNFTFCEMWGILLNYFLSGLLKINCPESNTISWVLHPHAGTTVCCFCRRTSRVRRVARQDSRERESQCRVGQSEQDVCRLKQYIYIFTKYILYILFYIFLHASRQPSGSPAQRLELFPKSSF